MEGRYKKKMRSQEKEEEKTDLDSLSCLPDSILSYILSFLDTNSAVRTSVLSKRYRFVWTLSPRLDFKLLGYTPSRFDLYDSHDLFDQKDLSVSSFESYVNRVMQCREHSNLTMFDLELYKAVGSEFISNCIDYAARHKVQHLRIRSYTKRKPVALPRMLLTSNSLTILHLNNAVSSSIELPKSLSLPKLKILRLKNFEFSDRNYNGEIFSGCSSLETLVLKKCWIRPGDKLKILDVQCLNLKNLEIKYWRSPWKCFDEHSICVNAPRLCFFLFQGHLAKVNFRNGIPCLDKAWIDLCYPIGCTMVDVNERRQSTSRSFINMLHQLCSVKSLSISLKTIEVVSDIPDLRECLLPVFENLRFIKFTAEEKYTERTMTIATVIQLLKSVTSDNLVIDVSEEQKYLLECSKVKSKRDDASPIIIPVHFMYFLLTCSPSAELLSIELPKVPSDEI